MLRCALLDCPTQLALVIWICQLSFCSMTNTKKVQKNTAGRSAKCMHMQMGRKSTIGKKGECRSCFPSMVIKGHGYWVCDTLVPWEILFSSYILKRWGVAICKVLFEEVNSKLNSESDLKLDYWSKRVLCWKQILEVKRNYFLQK